MTIAEQIAVLFEDTLSKQDNEHKRLDIGIVEEKLSVLIKEHTGIDVYNYILTIDNYSILHTLERHGNPLKEAKKGQIGIQKHHFIEILDVVLAPDLVRCDTKRNKTSLIFEKEKGDRYFVVKEIRQVVKEKKKNRLVLQSFYIRKKTL